MDLRPALGTALDAFALPAVVTPPGGDPVETRAFWLPTRTEESEVGTEFRRSEARRILVLPASDVPQVPRGTRVSMAEYEGGATREWSTDSMQRFDSDHHRVWVVPYVVTHRITLESGSGVLLTEDGEGFVMEAS